MLVINLAQTVNGKTLYKTSMKEIAIETLLFGDFHVAVYENQQLVLDKKYYCAGRKSAEETAKELQKKYPDYQLTNY